MRVPFARKHEETSQLSAYVKSLNQQIDDATKMKTLVETPGWALVQALWKEYEDRSQVAFMVRLVRMSTKHSLRAFVYSWGVLKR